jgi:farnesol dehydrogenase
MSATTVITGATGFIGQRLTRALLAAGASVRVLVRHPERLGADLGHCVEVVRGDVGDPATLAHAFAGARTVIHLAACVRAWSRDPAEFHTVNEHAVAALLQVAEEHGVERIVHVSTILTLTRPRARTATPYETTKLAGERLVERSGRGIIVHPTRVYGPGPLNDANGVTRVVAAYLAGRFRVRLADRDVQGNYVHVDDVAAGILLVAHHGIAGRHYVLHGENASLRVLLDKVAILSGVPRHVLAIHPRLGVAAAAAAELWGRCGGQVPITRDWVHLFLEDQRVDTDAALQALGYVPRPLDAGLAQTIAWLRTNGRSQPC